MGAIPYTTRARLDLIQANLPRYEKEKLSYRQIALEIQRHFGLSKPPSPATIGRDYEKLKAGDLPEYEPHAQRLLEPENFGEFRALFTAPGGLPYETPPHQLALFWIIFCLAEKVNLPDWVIKWYSLPEDINDQIILKRKLLTFVLLYAPRHGKTMLVTHTLIWLMCRNPNIRILYCQGVLKTSVKAMKMIMSELVYNEDLLEMFGPFRHDDKQWNNEGFIVARRSIQSITPTFAPIGLQVNIRSLDADIIIVDDPQDKDRAESETTTRRDYEWLTTELMTRREPHTPVFMVGSHVPTLFGDVFTQLGDKLDDLQTDGQAIFIRKVPAHDVEKCDGETHDEKCLLWANKRGYDFLESQRAILGEELYEAVYQQEARTPGSRPFPAEIVKGAYVPGLPNPKGLLLPPLADHKGILDSSRSWKEEVTCCGTIYRTVGFDPASSESRRASQSALAVLGGCIRCKRIYAIDYWAKRQSPEMNAGTIDSFAHSFGVHYVRIEINAYQKALARDPELLRLAREHRYHVDEWRTDDRKNDATFGIPNLARWMKDGLFSVPYKTEQDQWYARDLISALVRYPLKPNDIPMSLWLAASMMWQVWESYADVKPIILERLRDQTPQYMVDNPLRVNLSLVSRE